MSIKYRYSGQELPSPPPAVGGVDDGGWAPAFTEGSAGITIIGPDIWQDGNWEGPVAQPASLAGGDGNIGDITFQRWPVPPSRIDPWIGEQGEWPTPAATTIVDDTADILGLLRAPVVSPPQIRAPWTPDQDDLPKLTAVDDGGWVPFFSGGMVGSVTVDPSSWVSDDIVPQVQPSAPPVEDWDPFRLMGLPVTVPPPSRGPDYWTLDEVIGTPPIDEEWYDLPLRFVAVPGPQRPNEWSWINDLVPTPQVAPATDEPGTLDWLLRVAAPVYSIFDRNVWDLDQDYPALESVIPEIVDSPTRLLVLNYQATVLYVLDHDGNPMSQPLSFTAGEAGPLTLACAGIDGTRQPLSNAVPTLRLVNVNATVYADGVTLAIVNSAEGVVRWDRLPAQVSVAGDYRMQVKVTFADGTFKYFPDANPTLGSPVSILAAV